MLYNAFKLCYKIYMETRVLKYFLAVAKEGSMTSAAKTLHITQPTLSRQIMELEEEVGHKLFTRGYHSLSLTMEGMFLRKRAEEIMDIICKTASELKSANKGVSGDVYIGCGESKSMEIIAEAVNETRKEYPEVHFHFFSGNSIYVSEQLEKGVLDFGVFIEPADTSNFESIALPAKDVWGVVMRNDCRLAKKKSVKVKDLIGLPLICSRQASEEFSPNNAYKKWFGKYFEKLDIVASYNLIYNASIMVRSGVGYAITLDKLLNVMGGGDLCFKPLSPRLESGLKFAWKKRQVFSGAAEMFLERMKRKFAK